MNLIFLGAPGAGKGTQAEVVSEALNIPQISTGNILREAAKNGTEYGLKAKAAMDAGALVSDDIVIGILKERIAEDDCKNGFILDGFPRTVPQAQALDEMNIKIDKVVEISVADETIKQRVSGRRVCEGCGASYHIEYKPSKVEGKCDKCGAATIIRKDDQPETVLERLAVYHEKTAPLKDYYEKQG
ncbi:MAG: adenylate kinase, partial [Firmicutes bacterium]|nr:adenylate kinase [Bacillota bacterium]